MKKIRPFIFCYDLITLSGVTTRRRAIAAPAKRFTFRWMPAFQYAGLMAAVMILLVSCGSIKILTPASNAHVNSPVQVTVQWNSPNQQDPVITLDGNDVSAQFTKIDDRNSSASLTVSPRATAFTLGASIALKQVTGGYSNRTASTNFFVDLPTQPPVPNPVITGISPSPAEKGTTLTLTGTGFSATCTDNQVKINGGAAITPSSCSATSLGFAIPQTSGFGSQQLTVTTNGRTSASHAFVVARTPGAFVEISNDIIGKTTNSSCGSFSADICQPDCIGHPHNAFAVTFKKSGTPIGGANYEFYNLYTVGGLAGAGISNCNTAIVLNGSNGMNGNPPVTNGIPEKQLSFSFRNLETNVTPNAYNISFALSPGFGNYMPRIFRSPDGSIILLVSAAITSASNEINFAFIDVTRGGGPIRTFNISPTPPGTPITSTPMASITNTNQINFTFGAITQPAINIP